MRFFPCLIAGALLGACATGPRSEPRSDISEAVRRSERGTQESLTLSRLAALERSLNDFIQAEGRIPAKLNELIPKYLAEIPETSLDSRDHRDSSRVFYYPPETIVDGQINGAALQDTGGWGYAYSDRQVIVFVNCTHKSMNGQLWYQARGVY